MHSLINLLRFTTSKRQSLRWDNLDHTWFRNREPKVDQSVEWNNDARS